MKLISESSHEDQLVAGLTALLCDLGVNADGFTKNEALALTFISPDDIDLESASMHLTRDDQLALIHSIEDNIRASMIAAGYETIGRAMCRARGGKAHINRQLGS